MGKAYKKGAYIFARKEKRYTYPMLIHGSVVLFSLRRKSILAYFVLIVNTFYKIFIKKKGKPCFVLGFPMFFFIF